MAACFCNHSVAVKGKVCMTHMWCAHGDKYGVQYTLTCPYMHTSSVPYTLPFLQCTLLALGGKQTPVSEFAMESQYPPISAILEENIEMIRSCLTV